MVVSDADDEGFWAENSAGYSWPYISDMLAADMYWPYTHF